MVFNDSAHRIHEGALGAPALVCARHTHHAEDIHSASILHDSQHVHLHVVGNLVIAVLGHGDIAAAAIVLNKDAILLTPLLVPAAGDVDELEALTGGEVANVGIDGIVVGLGIHRNQSDALISCRVTPRTVTDAATHEVPQVGSAQILERLDGEGAIHHVEGQTILVCLDVSGNLEGKCHLIVSTFNKVTAHLVLAIDGITDEVTRPEIIYAQIHGCLRIDLEPVVNAHAILISSGNNHGEDGIGINITTTVIEFVSLITSSPTIG